jgi:hypothetical protein
VPIPPAVTDSVAVWPFHLVCDDGCVVIVGAPLQSSTVTVAVWLFVTPQSLVTRTQ